MKTYFACGDIISINRDAGQPPVISQVTVESMSGGSSVEKILERNLSVGGREELR